ncbi:MAG: ribosomal protein S18-alanine N-acetyltransferase [Clostridia bacterium]|jgi:ribosomal-protein-alanine N-acetyltransferase|nr:ribosomal protein S18-alanine N-acetyltransferase [Clostridia bacterium]
MGEECTIRKMMFHDIDQVLEVERLSFPSPWSRNAFEAELHDNLFAHYFVAEQDETIVGYAGMWMVLDEAHVTNIAVHPAFRGLNYGKRLTQELIIQAFKLGANRITLEVRVSNLVARNLYKGLGFREVGVRKGYYSDNNEDAIIMWKNIQLSNDYVSCDEGRG